MIDTWGVGCMFYAMLYGDLPFWGNDEQDFIHAIVHDPVKFPASPPVSKEAKDIIKGLLEKKPEKRLPLLDLQTKAYMKYEDEEFEDKIKKLAMQFNDLKAIAEEEEEKAAELEDHHNLDLDEVDYSSVGVKKAVKGKKKG